MEGEERRCRMCYEERKTIEHMWNECNEMRERERKRKEREEILNEDGREIRWMNEIWKRRGKNRKRKGWRIEIKMLFLCLYSIVIRNPKAHRANKAYYIL
jgi:hypothetical protein